MDKEYRTPHHTCHKGVVLFHRTYTYILTTPHFFLGGRTKLKQAGRALSKFKNKKKRKKILIIHERGEQARTLGLVYRTSKRKE